jgi:phosphate transport system substrate-binding protein
VPASAAGRCRQQRHTGLKVYRLERFARCFNPKALTEQTKADEWVAPTPASVYAAVVASDETLTKDLSAPIVDPPATAKGAFPITGITFILIPKDNPSTDHEQVDLKNYINYTLTTGQDVADETSYAKLPNPVQKAAEGLLSQFTDNGKPIQ